MDGWSFSWVTGILLRSASPTTVSSLFLALSVLEFQVFDPFGVDFHAEKEMRLLFYSSTCSYPVSPEVFVEDTALSLTCVSNIFVNSQGTVQCDLNLGPLFYFICSVCPSLCWCRAPFLLASLYLCTITWFILFGTHLFAQDYFGYVESFVIPHGLIFFIFLKDGTEILMGITLNLQIGFGRMIISQY